MTLHLAADRGHFQRVNAASNSTAIGWAVVAGLFGAAILLRHMTPGNSDVSWLLIAGER